MLFCFFFFNTRHCDQKKKKKTIGDKKENFPVINSHNLNPYQLWEYSSLFIALWRLQMSSSIATPSDLQIKISKTAMQFT